MPHKTGKRQRIADLELALKLLSRAAQAVVRGSGGAATMTRIIQAQGFISDRIHKIKEA